MQTREVTLEHPAGRVRVEVPADVRLEELMPDLLDVAAQPDRDDWVLGAAGGPPYPANLTLAQLGVTAGSVLVLHTANANGTAGALPATPPPAPEDTDASAPAPVELNARAPSPPAPSPEDERPRVPLIVDEAHYIAGTENFVDQVATHRRGDLEVACGLQRSLSEHDEQAALRPVSARTARTLPSRLSTGQRVATAGRALVTRTPLGAREQHSRPTGVPDPALFALPGRVSPLTRMRQAWQLSDYERLLEQLIIALHLRRCVTIAVVSPKGGVGKSTTTALLGSLLAFLRRDRVVAVDTNPDWGSLGRRLVPDHPVFIDDLLAGPLKDGQLTPTQLDAQPGRGPDGLMVAPAPTDPDRGEALDEAAYRTLFARLGELVGTLVLDCGTGLKSPAARAALGCADQLVLVADDEPDSASLVAEAAETLRRHAPPLTLAANKLSRSSRVDVDALEREIPFARGITRVPINKAGAQQLHASRFSWTQPPSGWTIPIRQLAALLAADWPHLDIAR